MIILRCVACGNKYESSGRLIESNLCPTCRDFAREEKTMFIALMDLSDALDELGKAILYSFEPFLKWCINVLNKIIGAKK